METEEVKTTETPTSNSTGYMGFDAPAEAPKGVPSESYIAQMNELGKQIKEQEVAKEQAPTEEPKTEPKKTEPAKVDPPVVVKTEPEVTEKIVEKIIEKYPEFADERSKSLFESFQKGELDKIYDYLTGVRKNYDTMSHVDLIKENLAIKNPQWTKDDIELEIRVEYGDEIEIYDLNEIDKESSPEEYKEAEAHNKQAERNRIRLERDARNARIELKELQKTIEFPKIKEAESMTQPQAPTPEQVAAAQKAWSDAAETQVAAIEGFKFDVGDKDHPENVDFNITAENKAKRIEAMKTWDGADFMKRRGWQKEDGSFDLLQIAKDEEILANVGNIVKSAYADGFRNGSKKVVSEDIKNVDLEAPRTNSVPIKPMDAGELVWA